MLNRVRTSVVWLTLAALLAATPAWARQHIVEPAALESAIAAKDAADAANRQVIAKALDRADVRQVAERLGLDIKQAHVALAALDSDALALAAQPAVALDSDAAGGQVVVISLTTLLLIILLIVLIT